MDLPSILFMGLGPSKLQGSIILRNATYPQIIPFYILMLRVSLAFSTVFICFLTSCYKSKSGKAIIARANAETKKKKKTYLNQILNSMMNLLVTRDNYQLHQHIQINSIMEYILVKKRSPPCLVVWNSVLTKFLRIPGHSVDKIHKIQLNSDYTWEF